MVELDETFSLNATIINSNGQDAQFTAGGESASATIMDDDGKVVCTSGWTYINQVVPTQCAIANAGMWSSSIPNQLL